MRGTDVNEQAGKHLIAATEAMRVLNDAQRGKIVFIAAQGALFQGLLRAVQTNFPNFDVDLLDTIDTADLPEFNVRLVLLHTGGNKDVAAMARQCHKRFPGAAIGLLVDDVGNSMFDCEEFLCGNLVQGLLPLSLQLNVWLAAMSLLVAGGQYYPLALLRRDQAVQTTERARIASQPEAQPRNWLREGPNALTAREHQVLELVSQGFQNKLIANRMSLSEHTVKVHVHNLITKLRVSNRTQAAAAFRSAANGESGWQNPARAPFTPQTERITEPFRRR